MGYSPVVRERAFRLYLMQSVTNWSAIAKAVSVSKSDTISRWAEEENWEKYRNKLQEQLRNDIKGDVIDGMAQMDVRHARLYRIIQAIGIDRLEAMVAPKEIGIKDAIKGVDVGVKGERLVRGQPIERMEIISTADLKKMMSYIVDTVSKYVTDPAEMKSLADDLRKGIPNPSSTD